MLGKLMNTYHVYIARMNPTPNRSTVLQRLEGSNAIKIRNGVLFDFYSDCHILLVVRYHGVKLCTC